MQSTNDSPHIKLLYLLIQNKTNVHYLLSVITEPDSLFTESSHKAIFKACAWARDKDKTVSTEQFEYFCKFNLSLTPQKTSVLVAEYAAIESIENVKTEDISVLIEECKNLYYYRFLKSELDGIKSDKSPDFCKKLNTLHDHIGKCLSTNTSNLFSFHDTVENFDNFVEDLRQKSITPEKRIVCGIKEIDDCMTVGFRPGTLTLTVADVGGGKSTMMLNIAYNLWKKNANVLFIPLEMPWEEIFKKFLSRETLIEFEKFARPELMTEKDWDILKRRSEELASMKQRLVWADVKNRPTVQEIRRAIESKFHYFKPDVVVIDYIANIKPDGKVDNWLAIGDILKELRAMGKQYGFAILSAAQMTRDGIKKLKSDKDMSKSPGSEDLRGSHEYSADADNIFAQAPSPEEPYRKMLLWCIKARYGKKTFDGKTYAILDFYPEFSKIDSSTAYSFDINDDDFKKQLDLMNGFAQPQPSGNKSVDDFGWMA
jgi:replicative DNA helicase